MRDADGRGHYLRKNGWPRLREKEFRIAWIERRIQDLLDGGQIDGLVFDSEVISVDQHSRRGKKQKSGSRSTDCQPRIGKRETRNKKPGNHSALWKVSTYITQS